MPITIDACVAQHIGDRKEQQDRVGLFPHPKRGGVALAVVADGMGGHAGGALAAEQVLYTARSNLDHYGKDDAPQTMLEASINEAHTMIKAMRMVNEKDPHSTAVMMLLQPGKVSWAHCGDSRLYRFRTDKPFFRTIDHSYVEHLIAEGKITPEQALVHPNRNILLTSMGGGEPPRISYGESTDLRGGDSFLLCSDGLIRHVSFEEIETSLGEPSAELAAERLLGMTLSRGAVDNVSICVVEVV